MAVNKERVTLLVDALESGEYDKGEGYLHNATEDTWCCLGLACKVAQENGLEVATRTSAYGTTFFDGQEMLMPQTVMNWFGFNDQNPPLRTEDGRVIMAARWNDRGQVESLNADPEPEPDFTQIAAGFRRTYLEDAPLPDPSDITD